MTKVGDELLASLGEALAYASGEPVDARVTCIDGPEVDARSIRKALGLTQQKMALLLGTSVSGYRKWEQGERQPGGAARTLLRVMEKEPEAVARALM